MGIPFTSRLHIFFSSFQHIAGAVLRVFHGPGERGVLLQVLLWLKEWGYA